MIQLDAQQEKIASHASGHALVLAGAGSGKTTCIIERTARRIENGVAPPKILMMTFTNKAAREMESRLRARLNIGPEEKNLQNKMPRVTTYHSFGHQFIHKYPEACLRRPGVTIMTESDTKSLYMNVALQFLDKKVAQVSYDAFSMINNEGLDIENEKHEKIMFNWLCQRSHFSSGDAQDIINVWQDYNAEKYRQNILDFDDLINLPIQALKEHADIRLKINQFLVDITIDEAQDNNKAQYTLLKLLAPPVGFQSIVMIGDDDQSIHRWRGARPDNMKAFQDEYSPNVYLVENNYRSEPVIVEQATCLIRHNTQRMEKNPKAVNPPSSQHGVALKIHKTGETMAEKLVTAIQDTIRSGVKPGDIAVLYRTNKMADFLQEYFLKAGIPYSIKKGTEIIETAEAKMLIAAMRLAINPYDQMAFQRIAEIIPGLGKKRIETLVNELDDDETIFDGVERLTGKAKESTERAIERIQKLAEVGPEKLLAWANQDLFKNWLEKRAIQAIQNKQKKNYDDPLTDDELKQAVNERLRKNMRHLRAVQDTINVRLNALTQHQPNADILQKWSEALDVVLKPPEDEHLENTVTLCTAHSAKGLEWDIVHIAGFSEGLMPLVRKEDDSRDISITEEEMAEERCLAYVAMTRAKKNLVLHHAKKLDLMNGSGLRFYQLSRFYYEAELNKLNKRASESSCESKIVNRDTQFLLEM